MLLNAALLTTRDRCPRRYRLETQYRVTRVRPKDLFDRLFREAVFSISNGADPREAAEEACTQFLEACASPGLDFLSDPWTMAQDFCAIFRTSLEAISRQVLLTLKRGGTIKVGEHAWDVASFRDDSGILHRWTSVDRWDQDAQYRELHSWHVFGDCAATGQGMVLHVLEIGKQARGHQQTPWCRAYKHPVIAGHFRFRHVDGGPLQGNWKPVFFQDSKENNPKTWVDLMEGDNLSLLHHLEIREPHPVHVKEFERDVQTIAQQIGRIPDDWSIIPRRRTSCDIPPCPWQNVCYAPPQDGLVNIEGIGGYSLR